MSELATYTSVDPCNACRGRVGALTVVAGGRVSEVSQSSEKLPRVATLQGLQL